MMTSNTSVPVIANMENVFSRPHPTLRDHFGAFLCGSKIKIEETDVGSNESFQALTHQKVPISGEEIRVKTERLTYDGSVESFVDQTCQEVSLLGKEFPIKTESSFDMGVSNNHFTRVPIKTEKPDEEIQTDCETYIHEVDRCGMVGTAVSIKSENHDCVDEVVSCQPNYPAPLSSDAIKIEQEKEDTVRIKTEKEDKHHNSTHDTQVVSSTVDNIPATPIKVERDDILCDIRRVGIKTEILSQSNMVESEQIQKDFDMIDNPDGVSHRSTNRESEYKHNRSIERKAKEIAKIMLKELEENVEFDDTVDGKLRGSQQKSSYFISYISHSTKPRKLDDLNNEFNKYKDMFSLQECSVKVQRLSAEVLIHHGIKESVLIPEKKTHLEILKKGLFPCTKCSFRSDHLLVLQRHLKSKHDERRYYKCEECDYLANWAESLAHHVKRVHRKEKPWACKHCNHSCLTKQELRVHDATHTGEKPYKCPHCEYRASHRGSIKSHVYTHTGEKPFACPHCSYRCTQYPHLKSHLYIHANSCPFECKLCSFKTRQSTHLRTHMRLMHTNIRPYKCNYCDYAAKTASTLRCHERKHTGEKPYCCHLCPYKTRQGAPLRSHIRRMHAAASSNIKQKT